MPLDARSLDYGMFVEEGGHQVEHKSTTPPTTPTGLSVEEVAANCSPTCRLRCAPLEGVGDPASPSRARRFSSPGMCAARRGPAGVGTWWASGRPSSTTPRMDAALAQADAVIHLAGVNRAHDPSRSSG